jgi:hypothetical protein
MLEIIWTVALGLAAIYAALWTLAQVLDFFFGQD